MLTRGPLRMPWPFQAAVMKPKTRALVSKETMYGASLQGAMDTVRWANCLSLKSEPVLTCLGVLGPMKARRANFAYWPWQSHRPSCLKWTRIYEWVHVVSVQRPF